MIHPEGTLLSLLMATNNFAFGDHRRGHVEYHRISAGDRHADRDRIGRESAVAAAERRDALRARRVQEVQRHLARGRRQFGPVADAAEVAAVAQADHRDAGLRRLAPCRVLPANSPTT